jgi:hypothetical protein
LATIRQGRPALLVLGIDRPADAREIALPDVDEAYSPTWSPDGRSIAFSAMKAGVSDLYVADLATGGSRQLTDDAYADLQPAWSPDGQTIAFTTDRFTTNLTRLTFGAYRIGLIDVVSGALSAVPAIRDANQIDPAWSPDGSSLYFVADPDGWSNVYRAEPAVGRVFRLTDVETGVSGVTRISPALSVSSGSGALAFNVFRRGGYEVHTIASADLLHGTPVDPAVVASALDVASAVPSTDGAILPVPPLPSMAAGAQPQERSYRPTLSLEAIGSPYFSAGGGPLGSYVSGGASLLFGDLLGDQQLMTAVHLSSRFDESALGAVYVNRKARVNWGVTLEQTPHLRLRTNGVHADSSGSGVVTRERERMIWTTRHLGTFAAYPMSRSRRIEVSAGFRQISVTREQRIEQVSARTGMTVDLDTHALPTEPSIGLADAGVALIGDTSLFGATGPLLGSRYRFQTTVNTGGLSYVSLLADYRRYLMPVRPYTLALRIVHAGRYGGDAADFRLRDSYLGSPSLVRGYGPAAVVRSECPGGSADCPALNTLLANRIVAAKMELRVPLWSTMTSTSKVRYGALPADVFLFADAGAGWGGEQRFGSGGFDGRFVRSVGAGFRVNVIGLIVEMAAIRPIDLKRSGWSFGFDLRPGF